MPKKIVEIEEVKVTYQVWVLGYMGDEDRSITDYDEFLAEFATEDEAVEYAESLTLAEVKEKLEALGSDIPEDVRYLHLQVETVEDDGEYEENVDTVYETDFDLYEEE
jgi:hypothetical protein